MTQPGMPQGSAGWVCLKCADRLPLSPAMQRRVAAALKLAAFASHVVVEGLPDDGAALWRTPLLMTAIAAAREANGT